MTAVIQRLFLIRFIFGQLHKWVLLVIIYTLQPIHFSLIMLDSRTVVQVSLLSGYPLQATATQTTLQSVITVFAVFSHLVSYSLLRNLGTKQREIEPIVVVGDIISYRGTMV